MERENTELLQNFVQLAKTKGAADEFLVALLTRRGWPVDDVYGALGGCWAQATGIPVPARSGSGESAKDAFLYLLSFSTLYAWTGALGSIIFELMNHWIPDPVSRINAGNLRLAVTFQMTTLAVAFPIYLLVMKLITRETETHPERLQSGVRGWLTYLALLGTASIMIGDLIWFLNSFLAGGLTLRFALKSATVMAICGSVFAYYFQPLKEAKTSQPNKAKTRNRSFGVTAGLTVAVVVCLGLGIAGTPAWQRLIELDQERTQDLQSIARGINLWHQQKINAHTSADLPSKLNEFPLRRMNVSRITDPLTGTAYQYQQKSGTEYELCARLASDTRSEQTFWSHDKGQVCFALNASESTPWQ